MHPRSSLRPPFLSLVPCFLALFFFTSAFSCKKIQDLPPLSPRPLSDTKELDILRITEVKNGPTALQIKIRLDLLGFQDRLLTVKIVLRLSKEGGGDAVIGTYTLATLTPKYKIAILTPLLELPYRQISISPGTHHLFFDLKVFSSDGKLVAATLNKDLCFLRPPPDQPNTSFECSLCRTFSVKGAGGCSPFTSTDFVACPIPAGSFSMGSPGDEKERDGDESPQRTVTISRPFWMMATEVTQGQFKALMSYNPSHFKDCGDNCPVESVLWDEAAAFANKLSAQVSLPSCFTCKEDGTCDIPDKAAYLACKGWRLPTEAEWEYAARAGTTTRFHTGNWINTYQANFHGDYPAEGCPKGENREKTLPVGSLAKNAWGLFDMHGNVWEWVADWYEDTYDSNDQGDPLQLLGSDPSKRSNRVIRGGSWGGNGGRLRSAYRGSGRPADRSNGVGFRLSRSL